LAVGSTKSATTISASERPAARPPGRPRELFRGRRGPGAQRIFLILSVRLTFGTYWPLLTPA
jgi:hypothetical protein